jgi:hypothetical protein
VATRKARRKKGGKRLKVRGAGATAKCDDDKNGTNDGARYTLGAGVPLGLNDNTSDIADIALKWALSVESLTGCEPCGCCEVARKALLIAFRT